MTIPSHFSETGIAVYANTPILGGGSNYHINLNSLIENYSHTIDDKIGYKSATIPLKMQQIDIEEWLENGIGRDINAFNEGGIPVWQGFVNDMEATIGGLTVKRGPLLGIANKVRVIYSTVDTTATPPTVGVRAKTAYANDTASQARYGIIEKILSTGGATEANAAYIRDTYLQEYKDVETTPIQIALGGMSDLSLTLNCLGYGAWLGAYTYNNTTAGVTTINARFQAILTADPNGIISTDYSHLAANTMSVPSWENDDPLANDYIRGLVALGDIAANRYTFGVYDDRIAYYAQMPTTQEYIWKISGDGQITRPTGEIVRPWDVRPAKWAHIPDFMIGRISDNTAMRDDPRFMFIESLTYTAPYGLTMSGAKVSKLPQILGQLGLMGIGA